MRRMCNIIGTMQAAVVAVAADAAAVAILAAAVCNYEQPGTDNRHK